MRRHAFTLLVILALSAVSIPHDVKAEDGASVVTVGVYENPPLLFTEEDGRGGGLFAELLEHIAAQEGRQIEYVSGNWEQGLSRLQAGKIDILPAGESRRYPTTSTTPRKAVCSKLSKSCRSPTSSCRWKPIPKSWRRSRRGERTRAS